MAVLIQNPDAIGRIADDLGESVSAARTSSEKAPPFGKSRDPRPLRDLSDFMAVHSLKSGYLQEVNYRQFLEKAAQEGAHIILSFRPGQWVLEGEPLACISPSSAGHVLGRSIRHYVAIGSHRVLGQDLEFGLARIVVKPAFDQIRQAAGDNVAVSIRLLIMIGRLSAKFVGDDDRIALLEQAAAIWETATSKRLAQMDFRDLEAANLRTIEIINGVTDGRVLPNGLANS